MTETQEYLEKNWISKGMSYKEVKMVVTTIDKEVKFYLPLLDKETIDEYVYSLDFTEKESSEINFWLQELGGANELANKIGLKDTIYTF